MNWNYSSPGIVLRVRSVGEKNRLLDILTPRRGIVQATAYGASSPKSRLRSVTQSFYCGEMILYENPVKQFTKVVEIDVQQEFSGLRLDARKLYAASLLSELLLATRGATAEDERGYGLCYEYLRNLADAEPEKVLRFVNIVLWSFLELLGEQPNLHEDVMSPGPLPANVAVCYLHNEGGITVHAEEEQALVLQAPDRMFLINQQRRSMAENARVRLPEGADRRLFTILCSICRYIIGRPLKSLSAGLLP